MNRRRTSLIILAAILCFSCLTYAETIREHIKRDSNFKIYAVIFGATVADDSTVQQFHVARVLDPKSGNTNDLMNVEIPKTYVDAARKVFSRTRHEPSELRDGKLVPLFVYYLYSPDYPKTVITDLDAPIDKQP